MVLDMKFFIMKNEIYLYEFNIFREKISTTGPITSHTKNASRRVSQN